MRMRCRTQPTYDDCSRLNGRKNETNNNKERKNGSHIVRYRKVDNDHTKAATAKLIQHNNSPLLSLISLPPLVLLLPRRPSRQPSS
mmetsp:Transcript_11825/g.28377  ORF Transcript_11825/g.28377 Transcript_11825/m.28377 type:complete len:86 (+) Transcript_11825:2410-2667(+)